VIANQWRLVDASKLPIDEQRAWAVVAARAVTPADAQQLAERIAGLQPEARELFLFTCAAENRHRKLRLAALGDLSSQRPSQTTFAMACRLVEAAPTWQQDRGQGARVLLLAMGDGKIDAPIDRIVAWTWQLAQAARDHEYRYAGSHVADGRSLLGGLAAASSEQAHAEAAARLAAVAASSPLEAGAAILAVASPRRGTAAERLIERARMQLSNDPLRLAAALGSNIPAPQPKSKSSKRAKAEKPEKAETVSFNGAVVGATPPAAPVKRDGASVELEVPPGVAVRLRDDADEIVRAVLKEGDELHWRLAGDPERRFDRAIDVRAAAGELAPLEISVGRLLSDGDHADRKAAVRVEGAGLVVPLEPEEAQALADDAARRVLVQLKAAGVRGRVRVEFQLDTPDGPTRDSRPGAVRKIARGEPVGASPERRERRRRSRSRGRRRPDAARASEAAEPVEITGQTPDAA